MSRKLEFVSLFLHFQATKMSEIVNSIKGFGTHYFKEKNFSKAEGKYKKALRYTVYSKYRKESLVI